MKEQFNKIKWVEINPYEQSTFPIVTNKHVLIEYKYNDYMNEYLVIFNPITYVIKEFSSDVNGSPEIRRPKVYLKESHNLEPERDKEITRWAILDLKS